MCPPTCRLCLLCRHLAHQCHRPPAGRRPTTGFWSGHVPDSGEQSRQGQPSRGRTVGAGKAGAWVVQALQPLRQLRQGALDLLALGTRGRVRRSGGLELLRDDG